MRTDLDPHSEEYRDLYRPADAGRFALPADPPKPRCAYCNRIIPKDALARAARAGKEPRYCGRKNHATLAKQRARRARAKSGGVAVTKPIEKPAQSLKPSSETVKRQVSAVSALLDDLARIGVA